MGKDPVHGTHRGVAGSHKAWKGSAAGRPSTLNKPFVPPGLKSIHDQRTRHTLATRLKVECPNSLFAKTRLRGSQAGARSFRAAKAC